MKIVTRETIVSLPIGTVFADVTICRDDTTKELICYTLSNLRIKNDQWYREFAYSDLMSTVALPHPDAITGHIDIIEAAIRNNTSFKLALRISERDICFEKDQLYAVYDREDILALVNRLLSGLSGKVGVADLELIAPEDAQMELKSGGWYHCKNGTVIRVRLNNLGGIYCYGCDGVNGYDWSVDDRWTIHGLALVDDGYDIVREIDPNYNFPA